MSCVTWEPKSTMRILSCAGASAGAAAALARLGAVVIAPDYATKAPPATAQPGSRERSGHRHHNPWVCRGARRGHLKLRAGAAGHGPRTTRLTKKPSVSVR